MHRWLAFLVVALGGVALGWLGHRPEQAAAVASDACVQSCEPRTMRVLGVGSCASMACHHGNGPRGSKGSEYSTWIAVDPHAKAYQTLFRKESLRMHDKMAVGYPEMAKVAGPHENRLCLKCHGMGDAVPLELQHDGAGCERCHGPAEKWNRLHFQPGFNRNTPGFLDLKCNLQVRVEACMKCHVGDATQEVNHDLIAAGHPRLRFEFAAYYANYPRHWRDDEKSHKSDLEARTWVVGQLVAAKASFELLAARAGDPHKVWPEFSEYDCASCHHNLRSPSERQARDLAWAKQGKWLQPGTPAPSAWYTVMLPLLAEGDRNAPRATLADEMAQLDALLRKRVPNRAAVQLEAAKAAAVLDVWLRTARTDRYDAAKVKALLEAVAARRDLPVEKEWDGAMQVYLALAALHNARSDVEPGFAANSQLREPLGVMKAALQDAFGRGGRPLYDGPTEYRSEAMLKGLDLFRKRLNP